MKSASVLLWCMGWTASAVRGQATTDCCRSLAVTAGNFVSTAHGNENLHFLAGTYVMFGSNRLNNEPVFIKRGGEQELVCGSRRSTNYFLFFSADGDWEFGINPNTGSTCKWAHARNARSQHCPDETEAWQGNRGPNTNWVNYPSLQIACRTTNPTAPPPTTASPSTGSPTSAAPSVAPSTEPPTQAGVTFAPTVAPTTSEPTPVPSATPTTSEPTPAPSSSPAPWPTPAPAPAPTRAPYTSRPTPVPTAAPSVQPDPGAGESGGSSGGDSGTNDESGTVVTVVAVMAVLVFLVVLGAVIFVSLHKAKAVTGAGGRATENPVYAAGAAPGAISIDINAARAGAKSGQATPYSFMNSAPATAAAPPSGYMDVAPQSQSGGGGFGSEFDDDEDEDV